MTATVKYAQTQLQQEDVQEDIQEDVEGLTVCVDCKKEAFNGAYCMYCGYPGKVRDRRKKKK